MSSKQTPEVFVKSLDAKGLVKMHNELHGRDLDSSTVTLHHIIVSEMRQRGMSHENVECELHKAVVLKSELVLPIEKARAILKGDKAGHSFRGNQWTKGGAGGSAGGASSGVEGNVAAGRAVEENYASKIANAKGDDKEFYNGAATGANFVNNKPTKVEAERQVKGARKIYDDKQSQGTKVPSYEQRNALGLIIGAANAFKARFGETAEAARL